MMTPYRAVVAIAAAWALLLVVIIDRPDEDVTCRIVPVTMTASWDNRTYSFTSAAICSNGGATLSGELRCQEDEPCWDCSKMGNLICGENKRARQ